MFQTIIATCALKLVFLFRIIFASGVSLKGAPVCKSRAYGSYYVMMVCIALWLERVEQVLRIQKWFRCRNYGGEKNLFVSLFN